jgi:hypothetical protein
VNELRLEVVSRKRTFTSTGAYYCAQQEMDKTQQALHSERQRLDG